MTDFIKIRNEKLLQKVSENLSKRHFEVYCAMNKEEALKKAIELIPTTDTISWGGSVSVKQTGLIDYLIQNNYKVINRDLAKNQEEKTEYLRQSLLAHTYLMGTNAMTKDGELVNIDCIGNRVAALMFGPKQVIMIAGVNKITENLDDAITRARQTAATINIQRVAGSTPRKTPCFETGICYNCKSEDSICSNIVITRLCFPKNRIKVILVNENLGF